ncbi:MAG: ATP synthase F1 subunit gamma [Bacteroidota bacterium]
MSNLKEVKGRIQSVESTQQITKAMKMVAASKLRKAQYQITQMRPYFLKMSEIIQNISSSLQSEEIDNPYAEERAIDKVLLVVVSSDRGLCGAFNSSVFKYARNLIDKKYTIQESSGNLYLLPIGKKSLEYFTKRNYHVIKDYSHLIEKLNFDDARETAEMIMDKFVKKAFDQVEIIYNEFKNVATQIIHNEQFLPIKDISADEVYGQKNIDYIYEPSQNYIFQELIPKSLKIQFYKTLLESNASEHGARMTAMDKATENADELLKELKLTYNRTRQAAITKEILEIVSGADALVQE